MLRGFCLTSCPTYQQARFDSYWNETRKLYHCPAKHDMRRRMTRSSRSEQGPCSFANSMNMASRQHCRTALTRNADEPPSATRVPMHRLHRLHTKQKIRATNIVGQPLKLCHVSCRLSSPLTLLCNTAVEIRCFPSGISQMRTFRGRGICAAVPSKKTNLYRKDGVPRSLGHRLCTFRVSV